MNTPEVTIIDYGVGNLLSVKRGFEHCGAKVVLTSDANLILASQRVVLPGVGAFPNAMNELHRLNLVSVIKELAILGTPLLAICLGMQLLMDESEEFGLTPGLGLISGRVVPVPDKTAEGASQKIPHIGWSSLYDSSENSNWAGTLLQDNKLGDSAYFVHSYMAQPASPKNGVAHAIYGGHRISAVISKNRITGCQFHPEKSGEVGLKILRKFCRD
jgi:glutamine amidotransferase